MSSHPLNFMDCNCGIGATMRWSLQTASMLIEKMDSLGIAEACPYALDSLENAPSEENRALLDVVRNYPRLHPVYVVGPHHCREFPEPGKLANELSRNNVRMVRLPLSQTSFIKQLDILLMEDLFNVLNQQRVPLILDCVDSLEQVTTDALKTICERWQSLPVILTFPKVLQNERSFYYLWERCNNFFVEMSGYQTLGQIENVTKRFGSGRIVFGSRHPYFTPLQGMLQIIYSDVEEPVKRDIAGDSVRRLLRGIQA